MSSTQGSTSDGGGGLDLSQFHAVFFEEADENLVQFEQHLIELDVASVDSEQLNAIFRCAHSIKGGAATFGFNDVTSLTHVMESLLDKLRRGELTLSRGMVDTLLESGDALKALLAFHAGEEEEAPDTTELIAAIEHHANQEPAQAGDSESATSQDGAAGGQAASPAPAKAEPAILNLVFADSVTASIVKDALGMFGEIAGMGTVSPVSDAAEVNGAVRRYVVEGSTCSEEEVIEMLAFHVAAGDVELSAASSSEADMKPAQEAATSETAADGASEPGSAAWGLFPGSSQESSGRAETGNTESDEQAAAQRDEPSAKQTAPSASGQKPVPESADNAPAETMIAAAPDAARSSADSAAKSGVADKVERAAKPAAKARGRSSSADSTLRVSVEKVDDLINLVGELVITQAMLEQNGQKLDPIEHQALLACLSELERNTRLLQESVMAVRMIPMGVVFSRFPRMMRDLENRLGKQLELKTVGEGTELDKGMVERITDPLTHLIRNAADHGIETPEDRKKAGKNPIGQITLSAQHRGGQICIEVSDDGKGLSREKLIEKAAEKGIPANDQMSDQDVWNLIMEPGFSTAAELTDISGRGVGMDVVKKNIQALGGSVRIHSEEGAGSTISVNLPLTLAIMDGMSVGIGKGETYILPLASVIESINLQLQQIRTVGGEQNVLKLRGDYIPIVDMKEMLNVDTVSDDSKSDTVVIVEADGKRAALVIDELIGQHQVVVKNLEQNYGRVDGVSGATILGDGRVAMILDVAYFVRRARH